MLSAASLLTTLVLICAATDAKPVDLTDFDSKQLGVRGNPVGENNSFRSMTFKRHIPCVGVLGSLDFRLEIVDVREDEPTRIVLALSDGSIRELDLTDSSVQLNCPYLQIMYGLAIAWFPNGDCEMMALEINPAWKPEDAGLIKRPAPPYLKPSAEDAYVKDAIDRWWENVVLPMDEAVQREHAARKD